MNDIVFSIWSPSEQVFRDSWVSAGVAEVVDGQWRLKDTHRGMHISLDMGWPGKLVKTPAVLDEDGNVITPAVMKDGIFINVKVYDPDLIAALTAGLEQYEEDEDGNQVERHLFDRTHAVNVFSLVSQPADSETGFPAGYRNANGVTYCDYRDINTPENGFG